MKHHQNMSLSGQWRLYWQQTGSGKPGFERLFESENTIPCAVPGDIHIALTEAGIIRDPLLDVNSQECRWLEGQEFWYAKRFAVEDSFLQERTEITFEGLDLTADIWLNGQYIGSHNNAFIEKVIDVTSVIRPGENEIVVRLDDGVYGVKDKPIDFMAKSWNAEQPYRAWMRKPQFVYGWDWTIWLPTCGIWKGVFLDSYRGAALRDVHVENEFAEDVTLAVVTEMDALRNGKYVLKCEVSTDERYEAAKTWTASREITASKPGMIREVLRVPLEQVRLWWPNGAGEQYLYGIRVTAEDEHGNVLQESCLRHGIRTVKIREDVLDDHSKSFTYVINGRRIFCKGANHVPADCFPGRITDEKNRALLTAAAQANMNMIRVWGGGIYESEGFLDVCDELGLMVWHDFMFACAYYPDHDPEFYEEIRREATAAIKRLRRHSSLVGWSGNNEIQEMYTSVKQWMPEHPWYGGRLYEELLPGLVGELCPDRIYRQSSPFGGEEPTSYDEGDQHTWHFTHRPGWEHYLDIWRFTDFDFKFLSEFGVIGAMNLESARKCIREEALQPQSPEWLHHTNTSSDHQLVDVFVKQYFPNAGEMDIQEYILKSQVIQAEIMRHIYDELRSRKFRCSGILLWTLSDSYGIHNWSVVDYYLGKRPVYYYLKRSMAPVNVSFMGYEVQSFDGMALYREYWQGTPKPIELLVTSDEYEEKQLRLCYEVLTFDGTVLARGDVEDSVAANSVKKFGEVLVSGIVPEKTILYAKVLEGDQIRSENRFFFAPYGQLMLEKARVNWTVRKSAEDQAELTLRSDRFVWMLHLQDQEGAIYSDNDFDLLPGREKRVVITGEAAANFVPKLLSLNPGLELVCAN